MNRKRKIMEVTELLTSSNSSEDEAEEYYEIYAQYHMPQKRAKILNFVQEVVPDYTGKVFKEHFRVARPTFKILSASFKRSRFFPNHKWGKKNSNSKTHMLSFLWYVGNKCVLRDVADRFGISISTQHLIISRVLNFFVAIAPNVIKLPANEAEKMELANRFEEISGFPGINGCLDGTYIEIRTPKHKIRSTYVNRHDKSSITLQGICDPERRFLDIFTGVPSKIHDSRVFKLSFIYKHVMNMGNDYHLLGDAAYPLSVNVLTPYRDYGDLTDLQKNYNTRFSKTRVKIENTFGLLKGRFRQLMKLENQTVIRMSKIILACCVLNNICINEVREDRDILHLNEMPDNAGIEKRNHIAEQLYLNRQR